ncbi:hypothetical protein HMPREF0322_03971 [Desulfitobacterium hafniense DP7]|uniref:Uncharacterized protein n=1 Tax=Desulfitobacterium hafniense DP7 TaxID=537010 RepID=G9XSJ9_DESHA|nr:hypothetical protein HMPREF0322_03971 [Desulfitobacterium hafniense DP7]
MELFTHSYKAKPVGFNLKNIKKAQIPETFPQDLCHDIRPMPAYALL